jgi:hypothetical protein
MMDQDHVVAIVTVSSLRLAATSFLTAHGVPVLGVAADGPEWITDMFSIRDLVAGHPPRPARRSGAQPGEGSRNVTMLSPSGAAVESKDPDLSGWETRDDVDDD